ALADPVKIRSRLYQGEGLPVLRDGAHHLDRLEREGFEGLLGPVALLLEARVVRARAELALGDVDALRAERVNLPLRRVGDRLVGLHLRQRINAAAEVFGELAELLLEVAVLIASAGGERERRRE